MNFESIRSRQCPPLIVFFGPDGAGKTTQVTMLAKYLESRGFRVKKIWIRNFHFPFAYFLSKLFVRFGYYAVEPNPNGKVTSLNGGWGRAFSIKALT